MRKYKIKFQNTQTSYYLDVEFGTETEAEEYIEINNLNGGYDFYIVEESEQ
jgi:hypothetical protein